MSSRRYSEDEFRAAVADPDVATISDLCRQLGIVPRGANYESVRAYADELGTDISHLATPPTYRQRIARMPEDEVRGAIVGSPSLSAAARSIGLPDSGGATSALRSWIEQRGIDTSHFTSWRPAGPASRSTYTDPELRRALEDPEIDSYAALCDRLGLQSRSNTRRRLRDRAASLGIEIPETWSAPGPRRNERPALFEDIDGIRHAIPAATSLADILRALGAKLHQGNYDRLRRTVEEHDLDLSGMGPPRHGGGVPPIPLDDVLVKGRRYASAQLRKRLVEADLKAHRCERCGRTAWNGAPIPLELDHIDGDRHNNELDNVRLLCPNCHALTPTYRGRNIGRANGSSTTGSE